MTSIYDPVECDLEAFRNTYTMAPELWGKFNLDGLDKIDFTKWNSVKLMNETGNIFSEQIDKIPTEFGGIYIYTINPGIIPSCGSYIMYIGMASKSAHENLRNRVKSYQKEVGVNYTRERLHRLFAKWGPYVHVHYLPIDEDKETIQELETRLIATMIPPCNADIQAKFVKRAVRAFS